MISRIEVDGFKSLSNFGLNLNKGVNILVGPNGVGKTNIVLFFEFLSNISTQDLSSSVSALGGAGSVFRKKGIDDYQNLITIKISGNADSNDDGKYFLYEYSAKIRISFEKDDVYYSEQELKILCCQNETECDLVVSSEAGELDLHILDTAGLDENKSKVLKYNSELLKPNFFFHDVDEEEKMELTEFERYISSRNTGAVSLVMQVCSRIEGLGRIRRDFLGGESFNIIPSKVKEQEDAASTPGIRRDGSGLATTLYAMKRGRPRRAFRSYPVYAPRHARLNIGMLEKIVSYLKLANNTITELDVSNDQFDNRLIVKVHVGDENYSAVLSLSSMSDGTLKWLTLIAAIMTSDTIFSIEEPENYLHPWMQAEIINIMRDQIDQKNYDSFVLITTHSESLLNHARASELIVVDFEGGSTQANRLSDIEAVEKEISISGFGLGNFYVSDALHHE